MRLAWLHRRFSLRSWLFVTMSLIAIFCIAQNMPLVDDHEDDVITISRIPLRRRHAAAVGDAAADGGGASMNGAKSVEQWDHADSSNAAAAALTDSVERTAGRPGGQRPGQRLRTDAEDSSLLNESQDAAIKKTRAVLTGLNATKRPLPLPSVLDLMPHLKGVDAARQPFLNYPNDTIRSGVKIVIGVPSVIRNEASYLFGTIQSLIFGMTAEEQKRTLIVVMLADGEKDESAGNASQLPLKDRIAAIDADFNEYLNTGLLHVIVPPVEWYPGDLHSIPATLGDSAERMYWRTKQNLDYMFLMLFCRPLGDYYLQVEDDVLAKTNYIGKIETAIEQRRASDWFILDFASLGFIGKLFRSDDLNYLTSYIALLYRYKPVDWILDAVFSDRYCMPHATPKECHKSFKAHRLRGPTLFQHVGVQSSLGGKVQKLKERNFGETMSFNPHRDNPPANVTTSLLPYQGYNIRQLYEGVSAFWSSQPPTTGDVIRVAFNLPTVVKGILIRTGNAEHPKDVVDERTSVLVRRESNPDKFEFLAAFGSRGVMRWKFEEPTSLLALMISFEANYTNWVVISEFLVRT